MPMLARVSFFVQLSIADLFFYRLPRAIGAVLVRLPLWFARALRRLVRAPSAAEARALGERDIEVVFNADDTSVAEAFGVVDGASASGDRARHGRPCLRYTGPLYSGHIHTIFNGLRPVWHRTNYQRYVVRSGDGQRLNLDVLLPSSSHVKHSAPQHTAAASDVRAMLLVIPGLLNASTTNYVRNFAYQAVSAGFGVCVLNYRGMGSTPLEVPRLFSATFTDDIRFIAENYLQPAQVKALVYGQREETSGSGAAPPVQQLHPAGHAELAAYADRPSIPLLGVGFSLGGVTLIKYISEEGQKVERGEKEASHAPGHNVCPLHAVVAVTSPFDLLSSDRATQRWAYHQLYEKPFAVGLRKFVKHNASMIERLPNVNAKLLFHGVDADEHEGDEEDEKKKKKKGMKGTAGRAGRKTRIPPQIESMTSIRKFDEYINATHNGFTDPLAYYAAAGSLRWLKHCHTPCLCLSDRQDPVCGPPIPSEQWHREVIAHNKNVAYCCFPTGGHIGFVGTPLQEVSGGPNIMERFVLDALGCFLSTRANTHRA